MEFTEKSKTRQTKRVGIGQLGESIAAKYLENKGELPECHFYTKRFKDAHPDETYKPE